MVSRTECIEKVQQVQMAGGNDISLSVAEKYVRK